MQYLLSTFRPEELRNTPVVLIIAAILSLAFLFSALYLRAGTLAQYLTGTSRATAAVLPEIPNTGASAGAVAEGPMVSFTFDFGYESAYLKALPVLDRSGFKATLYVVTDRIGHGGYINRAQMAAISKRGHEIGSLSQSHGRLTQLAPELATAEIAGSREILLEMGLPAMTFAYPHGETTPALQTMVRNAGFVGARSTHAGTNDTSSNVYALSTFQVVSDTTLEDVKAAIDDAVAERKWLIFVFYRVDENTVKDGRNTSQKMIEQIVNYVRAKNVPVVSVEEGLRG